jgi:cytosine deaminase
LDLILRNGYLPGRRRPVDVGIRGGEIVEIAPRLNATAIREIDVRDGLIAPGLVDGHMHLDKALTADRVPGGARGLLGLEDLKRAISASREIKRAFTVGDVRDRAITVARMSACAGTVLLRTHVDVDPMVGLTGLKGVLEARKACAPWIEIQIVAFPQEGTLRAPGTEDLLRQALELGADAIGGIPALDDDPKKHVDIVFALAKEFNRPIDMHVDESDRAEDFTLPYVLEKTELEGLGGQVTVAHISSLAVLPDEIALPTIARLASAGVNVCVNPIIIKITRLRELLAAGVNVFFGSDNIRDPFYPLGNGNPLSNALLACQLTAMGSHEELARAFDAVSGNAAQALGKRVYGLAEGSPADLVLFRASTAAEAIIDQLPPVAIIRQGNLVQCHWH